MKLGPRCFNGALNIAKGRSKKKLPLNVAILVHGLDYLDRFGLVNSFHR